MRYTEGISILRRSSWKKFESAYRGASLGMAFCLMAVGCSAPRVKHIPVTALEDAVAKSTCASVEFPGRQMADLTLGYLLIGDCPNWDKALAVATRKMGCNAGDPLPNETCRSRLPCDVCQFLRKNAWPTARVVSFPAEETAGRSSRVYGAVNWDKRWKKVCPVDDKTTVEIQEALCFGDGRWGHDKVDVLAKAMVHEALHLCRSIGANEAAMADKGFLEYLICPAPDAADLVEICWRPQS